MNIGRAPDEEGRESTAVSTGETSRECETRHLARGSPMTDGGFQINTLVDALADERRRYVLYHLRDEGNAEFEELIEQVVAWETETPLEEVNEQTRTNVRIDLYHAQLPKLERAGVIEYDHRHGSTCFQYLPDPVETFLDYCATLELPEANGQ